MPSQCPDLVVWSLMVAASSCSCYATAPPAIPATIRPMILRSTSVPFVYSLVKSRTSVVALSRRVKACSRVPSRLQLPETSKAEPIRTSMFLSLHICLGCCPLGVFLRLCREMNMHTRLNCRQWAQPHATHAHRLKARANGIPCVIERCKQWCCR